MPQAPKRPCSWPGCSALVERGRCDKHKYHASKHYDRYQRNKEAKAFYNSSVWRKARRVAIADSPVCTTCGGPPEVVHHVDGDRWNLKASNLMPLCNACHSRLEDKQRGGFAPRISGD